MIPAHAAAVRLHHLIAEASNQFNVVLLSDEADAYSKSSLKYFEGLFSVHLAGGRADHTGSGRVERIKNHSHAVIKAQLRMLAACYQPALVQIEFMELSKLIEVKEGAAPWLLTVHEAWTSTTAEGASDEDRYELALMKNFDAIITCCDEDAQRIDHAPVYVVPNGAAIGESSYVPSPELGPILFVGPFRYLPNLNGIQEFLERVYARLLRKIPGLQLWILGGRDAPQIASQRRCFAQEGVTVLSYVERSRELLDQSALTINPLRGVRGSCLKVAESIAAGRVCVSTAEGARGFLNSSASSLLTVNTVEEFEAPMERLLCDAVYRRSIERASADTLNAISWDHAGRKLTSIYSQLTQSQERHHGAQ
ncbi:MAG: glycosyltransferase [Acidobacteria bacterium]|nr:glycosyltransferase [Acidobacteriota bacterium]MBI3655874.1 glycosyltransferase [Acidobacteriota bacterium]